MDIIKDFENYGINENGDVYVLKTGKKLAVGISSTGYPYVQLNKNGVHFNRTIHRLLAYAYIPNPDGKPYVNHLDGNKLNNSLDNLEWCTARENTEHAAKVLKVLTQYEECNKKRRKPVQGTYPDGTKTEIFESIRSASRAMGVTAPVMIGNLKGRKKSCRGAVWNYV